MYVYVCLPHGETAKEVKMFFFFWFFFIFQLVYSTRGVIGVINFADRISLYGR